MQLTSRKYRTTVRHPSASAQDIMTVPPSIDAQLRSLQKQLKNLERDLRNHASDEDIAVQVADIANSCCLTLDKAMNAVWRKHNTAAPGKKKANVYFPVCATCEKFKAHLDRSQLTSLAADNLDVYNDIKNSQPFLGGTWLEKMSEVARVRHEEYPEIAKVSRDFMAFGVGQNSYIENLEIVNGQIKSFKGSGYNRETGIAEPLRVMVGKEVKQILAKSNEDPAEFAKTTILKTTSLVRHIFLHL